MIKMTSLWRAESREPRARRLTALVLFAYLTFISPYAAGGVFSRCQKSTINRLLASYEPILYPKNFGPKIGVEVEGWVSREVNRIGLAKKIEQVLQKRHPGIKIKNSKGSNPDIEYTLDGHHYKYKVTGDASIDHPIGAIDAEINSPILRSDRDVEDFKAVLEGLKSIGFTAEPNKSGIHVHVDFYDPKGPELATLHTIMSSLDSQLSKVFKVSPQRLYYTQPVTKPKVILDSTDAVLNFSPQDFETAVAQSDKYHSLNLKSLHEHNTVEFRLFNSTLDIEAVNLMMQFSQRFVKAVRTKDERLVRYFSALGNRQPRLIDVAKALDIDFRGHEKTFKKIEEEFEEAVKLKKQGRYFDPEKMSDEDFKLLGLDESPAPPQANYRLPPVPRTNSSTPTARRYSWGDLAFMGVLGGVVVGFAALVGYAVYAETPQHVRDLPDEIRLHQNTGSKPIYLFHYNAGFLNKKIIFCFTKPQMIKEIETSRKMIENDFENMKKLFSDARYSEVSKVSLIVENVNTIDPARICAERYPELYQ